jgi:hypothetical protein
MAIGQATPETEIERIKTQGQSEQKFMRTQLNQAGYGGSCMSIVTLAI